MKPDAHVALSRENVWVGTWTLDFPLLLQKKCHGFSFDRVGDKAQAIARHIRFGIFSFRTEEFTASILTRVFSVFHIHKSDPVSQLLRLIWVMSYEAIEHGRAWRKSGRLKKPIVCILPYCSA